MGEEEERESEGAWRLWVYASYALTLGAFIFQMGWWGSELNRLDGRITGTEIRMDEHGRQDRKDLMDRLDKLGDKLDNAIARFNEKH